MNNLAQDIKTALQAGGQWEKFVSLASSHQHEYIKWIDEAKRPETRANRIQKMLEMLTNGKKDQR